jgi:hypothetical protein
MGEVAMPDDGDTRSEIERLNQEEDEAQMLKHLPTNQELRAETHNHVSNRDGASDCRGRLEIIDAFGSKTEDAEGLGMTDSRFNKSTAVVYDFAFAAVCCQDPECKYPEFVLDNPRRKERTKYKAKGSWRQTERKDLA